MTVGRAVKGGFAARIKGVRYKDEADGLRGERLYVSRDALPNLPDDEFYHSDLIGLVVVDTGGVRLGVTLQRPIALTDGAHFAIREGGKTVGSGIVTKVTS